MKDNVPVQQSDMAATEHDRTQWISSWCRRNTVSYNYYYYYYYYCHCYCCCCWWW